METGSGPTTTRSEPYRELSPEAQKHVIAEFKRLRERNPHAGGPPAALQSTSAVTSIRKRGAELLVLKKSTIYGTLGVAVLVVFGLFVWPTRYRYDHMKLDANDYPVRISRLTGETEILFPGGWETRDGEQSAPEPKELPKEEVAKISGQAQINSIGWVEAEIYNGSGWNLSEITLQVNVSDANNAQLISRLYRLFPEASGDAAPQTSSKFHADLGFTLGASQSWSYSVGSAKGVKQ
ncbi:MAG TPA: hypothetical protein VN776_16280 [Terracidiphilus sp.]|nr:hypothetical protein [Terracidiphilus sp.]